MRHWFDGLAMLHRFTIQDGSVSYANRYLQGRAYRACRDRGRIAYREFATDPCRSLFKRVQTLFSPAISDNANVNVARLGERFVSMTETPLPVEFDPFTLETAEVEPYRAPGQLSTAHPHMDRARKGMINYAAKLGRHSSYRFFALAPGAHEPRVIASLPTSAPAYMHSFGLTERWLVLAEFPYVVNPLALALSRRPYIENYRWRPELGTRFTLVERTTGEARGGFQTDACFAFHHINSYDEDDGGVVVDLCAYENADIVADLYLDRLRAGKPIARATPTRFRLDLATRSVTRETPRRQRPRAAADQLRPLQRAPLPLRVGQRRRAERLLRADRAGGRRAGPHAHLVAARLLRRRARVRRPTRMPSARTTARSCRSCLTPRRRARCCSCWTRPTSASSPARRSPTTSRSASTACSRAAELLGGAARGRRRAPAPQAASRHRRAQP